MNKLFSTSILAMMLFFASSMLSAQADMDAIKDLNWIPCDRNGSDAACQLAIIRGPFAKDPINGMIVLVMIKGTAATAADRGQEQEAMSGPSEYVYIAPKPALRSYFCAIYGCVEGPSMYYLREKK